MTSTYAIVKIASQYHVARVKDGKLEGVSLENSLAGVAALVSGGIAEGELLDGGRITVDVTFTPPADQPAPK